VAAESVGRSIEGKTMNASLSQSLVADHIREARQQAAAARRVGQARHDRRRAGRRPAHRLAREV
jgi:hypothetical protein